MFILTPDGSMREFQIWGELLPPRPPETSAVALVETSQPMSTGLPEVEERTPVATAYSVPDPWDPGRTKAEVRHQTIFGYGYHTEEEEARMAQA